MYTQCILTAPSQLEVVFHQTHILQKPTEFRLIYQSFLDSWEFLHDEGKNMIERGEITKDEIGFTLELYSYNFITTKYSLEASIKLYGLIGNEKEFTALLENNPAIGNNFLNRLPKIKLNSFELSGTYNSLTFKSDPYSQNGSDIMIYQKKSIFLGEIKMWRK